MTVMTFEFCKLPMIRLLLVNIINGINANPIPKESMTWLNTNAEVGFTPDAIIIIGGIIVISLRTYIGIRN